MGYLPDAEEIAVQWARNNPALSAATGGRISTRLPNNPTFPYLTVFRASGGIDSSEALIDLPVMQWDCYGAARGDASPDYESASLIARILVAEAKGAIGVVGTLGTILGMDIVSGPNRLNEPVTGWARYSVDILMMVREGT